MSIPAHHGLATAKKVPPEILKKKKKILRSLFHQFLFSPNFLYYVRGTKNTLLVGKKKKKRIASLPSPLPGSVHLVVKVTHGHFLIASHPTVV